MHAAEAKQNTSGAFPTGYPVESAAFPMPPFSGIFKGTGHHGVAVVVEAGLHRRACGNVKGDMRTGEGFAKDQVFQPSILLHGQHALLMEPFEVLFQP